MDYLKKSPYFLDDEAIRWVSETIRAMTPEEKAAQLFVIMNRMEDEDEIRTFLEKYPVGGIRYLNKPGDALIRQNTAFQKHSRIPVFIAANCESGAAEVCKEGTFVATEAELGAARDAELVREMGDICGCESEAVGINWTFSPIVDIYRNSGNTIVNCRSFGEDPDRVLEMSRAYIRGVHGHNVLTCAKHFPGDGVDDRDHHLLMSVNDMSCTRWDATCGKVYRGLIRDGLESVMVGHIALPAYSKKLNPALQDEDILPATLSPELVNGLLRKKLKFNGLVITDATHMGGFLGAMPRSRQIPEAIAAGCDMILFTHDTAEDIRFMAEGIRSGVISEERLQNALEHILGMKARLGLHKNVTVVNDEKFARLGCPAHRAVAEKIADKAVTLIKDRQQLIPVDSEKQRRARLYFITNAPGTRMQKGNPVRDMVVEELREAGFSVDVHSSLYDLEEKEVTPANIPRIMAMPSFEEFRSSYDIVFIVIHMHGYSKQNSVRLAYSFEHSNELPWWIRDVPTVGISLNFTNHLYDLPMLGTYINAYAPTRECFRAAIQKVTGKSEFTGQYDSTVWCGRWDTKY